MEKVDKVGHHGKCRHSRKSVETTVIAQQRGIRVIVEHHGNSRHSAAAWKKVVTAQQRGKCNHNEASYKGKGDKVEHHRKGCNSTAA